MQQRRNSVGIEPGSPCSEDGLSIPIVSLTIASHNVNPSGNSSALPSLQSNAYPMPIQSVSLSLFNLIHD